MFKNVHVWLPEYIRQKFKLQTLKYPIKILFAIVDHFEPLQKSGDPLSLQKDRIENWTYQFERLFSGHRDSAGNPPLHTYFFPQEQYQEDLLNILSEHCHKGFGEVEIHIHHDNETENQFIHKISKFKDQLKSHSLLSRDSRDGKIKYGFIHGNWALDNSRRDGRWCGLNNEITLLKKTGCYGDFTLPSAPADGQTRKINSIYYADDDPEKPRSHDKGRDLVFGGDDKGDLLLIQGPLALNWKNRKKFIFPGIENGDISSTNPITMERIKIWIEQKICVRGKEDVVFIKVHCHGLKPRNFDFMLSEEMIEGMEILEKDFNDGEQFVLYNVTARELANIAMAYNEGVDAPISELRNFRLKWPPTINNR